jgi:hypothetical protein
MRRAAQLETTSLPLMKSPVICLAPQDTADEGLEYASKDRRH